jgi:hypothetical protein
MSDRKTFELKHRSCTLIVFVTNLEGRVECALRSSVPSDANQPTLWGETGLIDQQRKHRESKAMSGSGD